MSLPPHREKDAKVEGRDPPEPVKGTMGAFRSLTKRLLGVPMSEVKEQQVLFDEQRLRQRAVMKTGKKKLTSSPQPFHKAIADPKSGPVGK